MLLVLRITWLKTPKCQGGPAAQFLKVKWHDLLHMAAVLAPALPLVLLHVLPLLRPKLCRCLHWR
jgi:hypothetical protein